MKNSLILILLFPLFAYCQTEKSLYPKSIGDTEFDEKFDKKEFQLCNPNYIFQYFNDSKGFQYKGEKIAVEEEFNKKYNSELAKKESGLVRIRFVVNCKGETDRFRILGMNENYKEKSFDPLIINQLLQITKDLKGWLPKTIRENPTDYYQYLIFKIQDGKIIEILP